MDEISLAYEVHHRTAFSKSFSHLILTCHRTFLGARRCNVLQSCKHASRELGFQFLYCFAGENESRAIADTDSLLDVLEQFVQFYKSENGAHHKNVLKEDAVKQFLKLLSSVKGTVSSYFSPSQNLIAMKNVVAVNIQVLLSYPSFPSLFLQLILLEQCAFTYFSCCVLHFEPPEHAQNFGYDKSKCSNLFGCQHQDKKMQALHFAVP